MSLLNMLCRNGGGGVLTSALDEGALLTCRPGPFTLETNDGTPCTGG